MYILVLGGPLLSHKTCRRCKESKLFIYFNKDKYTKDGFTCYCKPCVREYQIKRGYSEKQRQKRKEDYYKNLEKSRQRGREEARKRIYGIQYEDFLNIVTSQDGKCAICNKIPVKKCLDHDHTTGLIRGMLCNSCNSGLGFFKDNVTILELALNYLKNGNLKLPLHKKVRGY